MSNKGSILKTLAGCGCILLVALLLMGAGTVYLTMKGVQKLTAVAAEQSKEFNPEALKEWLPEDVKIPEVDQKKVVEALGRPLEVADVDRFLAANEWFYSQPENAEAAEAFEEAAKDDVGLGVFGKAREAMESHTKLLDLLMRFNGYVGENGGYATQVDSAVRTAGVAAAADMYGRVKGTDPWADSSAKALKEMAAKVDGDVDLDAVAKKVGLDAKDTSWAKPGLIAFSKMPNKSFETWEGLPASKRKEVVEAYRKQGSAVLTVQLNPILKTGGILEILAKGL